MNPSTKIRVGIRTNRFSDTVIFLTELLNLEMVYYDEQNAVGQIKLPSGEIAEVYGSKNLWHPFTTPPDWELMITDIHHRE